MKVRIVEYACVAALRFDHLEENGQRRSVFERRLGKLAANLRAWRRAAQVNHPTGKDE